MKMEPIVSSETSAIKTQTPGNYPKRNKLHILAPISIIMLSYEYRVIIKNGAIHCQSEYLGKKQVPNVTIFEPS